MKITTRLLASTAGLAILAGAPGAALAQDAAQPAVDQAASDAQKGLGEIIVTAQRRAESSQRAAVPLEVIDGNALANAGITQSGRLNELAPALSIEPSSTGNLIFLRGVGNFTVVPTSDPAVAFNYDGVYVGRPTSTTGVFYDLQRVEILKGPQGTLYGRNATGGAINILPVQPRLGETSGYISATYGSYKTINADGAINVPLGEHGAVRLSASTSNHDGYLKDGAEDEKTTALRFQMKVELTPNLTIRTSIDYAHNGGVGTSVSYYGRYTLKPGVAISAGPVAGTSYYNFTPSGLGPDEGVYSPASQAYRQGLTFGALGAKFDALAPYPFQNNNFYGANAEIALKTGAGTLTVIPAYRFARLDYTSDAAAFIYRARESDDQYSLEARFQAQRFSLFDAMIGGYYYHETIRNLAALSLSNTSNYLDQTLTTKSTAAFARLVANVTDRFRVVGGVRYTKDDKGFNFSAVGAVINCVARNAFGAPNCPTAPLIPGVQNASQLPFPFPAAGGAPIPVFTTRGPPNYLIIRTDTAFTNARSNSKTTYRGAVEYDVLPQSLAYASVETGFRAGGFSAATGFLNYQPEYLIAYTIGLKNRFLGNRAQLNLEGFVWDYTNQQINHVGLDLNGRTANYTQNVGKSRIKGVEAEGRFLVTPTTLVSADVQYLDAKQLQFSYTAGPGNPPLTGCNVSFNAANASPYTIDCAGQQSYNSPKWTINLAGQQTIPLGDYHLVLDVDTQFKGTRNVGFAYLPEQIILGTWRTNAQVEFGRADGRWSIAGYVRNIENHRVPIYDSTHPTASFLVATTTAPRTYGIRARYKF